MYSVYNRFIGALVREARKLKARSVINERQANTIKSYIESGKIQARLLLGGQVRGLHVSPTIFVDVQEDSEIANDEIFGPVLSVLTAHSIEDAIRIHNSSSYGLSASVFTKDINVALSIVDKLEAGVCYINAPTYGAEVHLPFGGVKQSGNGHREVGKAAIDVFSELKTIYIDYSGMAQTSQDRK